MSSKENNVAPISACCLTATSTSLPGFAGGGAFPFIPKTEIGDKEIAGFMDGDGCIGIYRVKRRRSASWHYVLALILSQSRYDKAKILRFIQKKYGGSLHRINNPRTPNGGRAQAAWQLRMTGWVALKLIVVIKPWLNVREKQAKLAEEFMAYRFENSGSARRGQSFKTMRLLPEHLEFYEKCRIKMKWYNRRGINNKRPR
jgi:hypothetical protein